MKNKWSFSLFFFLLAVLSTSAEAAIFSHRIDEEGRHEVFAELDPYYSSLDYVFSLTDDPIPAIHFESEPGIYWYLIKNIYRPRFLLFEASVNPLPIVGTEIRRHYYDYYDTANITPHFNMIKAITAGFPEPYAFSFFWGNVADFVKDESSNVVGKGYSGLLMSYGPKHIVNNIIVDDNWFELELKLKGSDERESHSISWSYALGTKIHSNENIENAIYISVKRSRTDYILTPKYPVLDFFIFNSEQEVRLDFDTSRLFEGKIIRYMLLFGKKFPMEDGKIVFSLGLGAYKELRNGYSGELEEKVDPQWNIVLRPNFSFNFD